MHRRFRTRFVLEALTSLALMALSSSSFATNPQVTVSVYDDVHVPREILARAEGRAAKIFGQVGVTVNWLDCLPVSRIGCAAPLESSRMIHLVLRIRPTGAVTTKDQIFGVAYLAPDGAGQYCDVFWQRAKDLQTNSTVGLASILAGVMAHEMGHLLLGSNAHAVSGIMQAHWEPSELRRIDQGSLLFLPEQGKRMRARISLREELHDVARHGPGN